MNRWFSLPVMIGVVDQLDPPGASVELADGTVSQVDVECLTVWLGEGDRFLYRAQPTVSCPFRVWASPWWRR